MAVADWIREFLDENPDVLYATRRPQTTPGAANPTRSQNYQDYYAGRADEMWKRYLGVQGQQLEAGTPPTEYYGDYLSDFPYLQDYMSRSRSARGQQPTSRYAPATPWAV